MMYVLLHPCLHHVIVMNSEAATCMMSQNVCTADHNIPSLHSHALPCLAAIQAGSKGGTIIQADVGNHNKQKATGITPLPSRIPNDHLPTNHDPTAISVPDMTLYEKIKRGRIIKRRYTIVVIKYCTDTRPEPQQTRADLQHTGLISSLTKSRYNTEARLITIILGMAG
jgi:hypothetical protein